MTATCVCVYVSVCVSLVESALPSNQREHLIILISFAKPTTPGYLAFHHTPIELVLLKYSIAFALVSLTHHCSLITQLNWIHLIIETISFLIVLCCIFFRELTTSLVSYSPQCSLSTVHYYNSLYPLIIWVLTSIYYLRIHHSLTEILPIAVGNLLCIVQRLFFIL